MPLPALTYSKRLFYTLNFSILQAFFYFPGQGTEADPSTLQYPFIRIA